MSDHDMTIMKGPCTSECARLSLPQPVLNLECCSFILECLELISNHMLKDLVQQGSFGTGLKLSMSKKGFLRHSLNHYLFNIT